MPDPTPFQTLRLVASLLATAAAILLCTALRHFSPSLTDPSSFLLATHHRCGWTLIAASTWAALESLAYLTHPLPQSSKLKVTSLRTKG